MSSPPSEDIKMSSPPPPEDIQMSSPEDEATDSDVKTFGSLLNIPENSLVALAIDIRARRLNTASSSGRRIGRIIGSRNLVHIIQLDDDFKLIIRVPAADKDGLNQTAAKAMESQKATLRLIATTTRGWVPVPEVYEFDATKDNTIGAPYICMRFLPGLKVSEVWKEASEDVRLKILTSVAQSMAQLKELRAHQIGSLQMDDKWHVTTGPCYHYKQQEDGSTSTIESGGPFDTIKSYLLHYFQWPKNTAGELDKGPEARAAISVISMALQKFHLHHHEKEPSEKFMFGLAPPGFDSQNIMVDDQGNLTGVLDWDLVRVLPRCVGYIRYPGWITRDWNPLASDSENWPDADELEREELERYRKHYNQALGDALYRSKDWKLNKNSHIWEAIWIAALHSVHRFKICCKLVKEVEDLYRRGTCDDMNAARQIMLEIRNASSLADWTEVREDLALFFASHQPY
ncbi:hypothetical protein QBC37DRAFT_410181 [Rhypophila decipiens]|uniref:Aminoglycoside phosphotransferase domain-containing protein n=1 Tax=Rhypophila decipiens TaxID=261697 RepID=A0AAN7BDN5_9PEZI|nr:hypothetical protein QBC37DRAFT_410181 [Rhypophila decipiens]